MSWKWAYDGVNSSIPRNSGLECSQYLTPKRQWIESGFVVALSMCLLRWGYVKARPIIVKHTNNQKPVAQQMLLVAMTFTLGMELGFKFASRTVIYILNPCHVTTLIQVWLYFRK